MTVCVCVRTHAVVYSVSGLKHTVPAVVLKPAHSRRGLCRAVGGGADCGSVLSLGELLTKHMHAHTDRHTSPSYMKRD